MEKYGVDLYFSGHMHSYERLYPVYKGKIANPPTYENPRAPTHVVTGSAGCSEGVEAFNGPRGPWSAYRSSLQSISHMTIFNSSHLYFEQVVLNGTVIDSFWLTQDNHGPF